MVTACDMVQQSQSKHSMAIMFPQTTFIKILQWSAKDKPAGGKAPGLRNCRGDQLRSHGVRRLAFATAGAAISASVNRGFHLRLIHFSLKLVTTRLRLGAPAAAPAAVCDSERRRACWQIAVHPWKRHQPHCRHLLHRLQ
jgi:hypothetical protein